MTQQAPNMVIIMADQLAPHFVGSDLFHGVEKRSTTDIDPATYAWAPDWIEAAANNRFPPLKP